MAVELNGCCLKSYFYENNVWNGKYAKRNDWSPIFTIFSAIIVDESKKNTGNAPEVYCPTMKLRVR